MRFTGFRAAAVVGFLIIAAILAACKSSGASNTPTLSPSASAAAKVALGEAQGCLQRGSFLTHHGRVLVKNCVENLVPPANRGNAGLCAIHAVLHHGNAARENALAACLTKYGAAK